MFEKQNEIHWNRLLKLDPAELQRSVMKRGVPGLSGLQEPVVAMQMELRGSPFSKFKGHADVEREPLLAPGRLHKLLAAVVTWSRRSGVTLRSQLIIQDDDSHGETYACRL